MWKLRFGADEKERSTTVVWSDQILTILQQHGQNHLYHADAAKGSLIWQWKFGLRSRVIPTLAKST